MANKIKEYIQEPEVTESVTEEVITPKSKAKKGFITKSLSAVFSGTFLNHEKLIKHIPFILFICLITLLYIANGYYADDKIRKVNKLTNELKELRSEYISTRSDLMFKSKQSEVAKSAEKLGLKESIEPPKKIVINDTTFRN
jgi:hypothetical protein